MTPITGRNIALGGYQEEQNVCDDLNTLGSPLRKIMEEKRGPVIGHFKKVRGHYKTDITNGVLNIQVKKFKKKQFQQVCRHWVEYIIEKIPNLKRVQNMLNGLCCVPLLEDRTVDKSKKRIPLCTTHYTNEQIDEFLLVLNENKVDILKFAFEGQDNEYKPNFHAIAEYHGSMRKDVNLIETQRIIEYLNDFDFEKMKSKTVIKLGGVFSLQRKGGDAGRQTANQLQMKVDFTRIKHLSNRFHFNNK